MGSSCDDSSSEEDFSNDEDEHDFIGAVCMKFNTGSLTLDTLPLGQVRCLWCKGQPFANLTALFQHAQKTTHGRHVLKHRGMAKYIEQMQANSGGSQGSASPSAPLPPPAPPNSQRPTEVVSTMMRMHYNVPSTNRARGEVSILKPGEAEKMIVNPPVVVLERIRGDGHIGNPELRAAVDNLPADIKAALGNNGKPIAYYDAQQQFHGRVLLIFKLVTENNFEGYLAADRLHKIYEKKGRRHGEVYGYLVEPKDLLKMDPNKCRVKQWSEMPLSAVQRISTQQQERVREAEEIALTASMQVDRATSLLAGSVLKMQQQAREAEVREQQQRQEHEVKGIGAMNAFDQSELERLKQQMQQEKEEALHQQRSQLSAQEADQLTAAMTDMSLTLHHQHTQELEAARKKHHELEKQLLERQKWEHKRFMEKEVEAHVQKAVQQKEAELTEQMANSVIQFKQRKRMEDLERQAQERAKFERKVEKMRCELEEKQRKEMEDKEATIKDLKEDVEGQQDMTQIMITENETLKKELREARKAALAGITSGDLDYKEAGLIDEKTFKKLFDERLPSHPDFGQNRMESDDDKNVMCTKLVSEYETLWIQNGKWHPFKIGVNGKEEINQKDEQLIELKRTWGNEIAMLVAEEALLLHQHNPSGRYKTDLIWNKKENRVMTLAEIITKLLNRLKYHKSNKKRK